jgi:hypothetical protein
MSSGQKITAAGCTNKPSLTISMLAWEKIWKITHGAKVKNKAYECSSLGIMSPDDPNHLLDIYVPEQENTTSDTEIEKKDKHRWIADMVTQGVDPAQLSLWHHTHADFNVFWSSTDVATIGDTQTDNIHWSIVTNVDGDVKIRADVFAPVRFWWDDCDYDVDYPSIDLSSWWLEQKQKMTFNAIVAKSYTKQQAKKAGNRGLVTTYPRHTQMGGTTAWGGTQPFDSQHNRYLFDDEQVVEDVVKSTKETHPYEILSNAKLQEAYDEALISHTDAMELEKALLLGVQDQGEIENVIDVLIGSDEEAPTKRVAVTTTKRKKGGKK